MPPNVVVLADGGKARVHMIEDRELTGRDGDKVSFYAWVMDQARSGTCTSHAVCAALTWQHSQKDLHPFYLHKFTQYHNNEEQSYDKGVSVEKAIRFANQYGVPVQLATFAKDSGGGFPKGTVKYGFDTLVDVGKDSKGSMALAIVRAVDKYSSPVVVSVVSTREADTGGGSATERIKDHMAQVPGTCFAASPSAVPSMWNATRPMPDKLLGAATKSETYRHSLLVVGYKLFETGGGHIYVKNSWGDGDWAEAGPERVTEGGIARMPMTYFDRHAEHAWVGCGSWSAAKEYDGKSGGKSDSDCSLM